MLLHGIKDEINAALKEKTNNTRVELPRDIDVQRSNDTIVFKLTKEAICSNMQANIGAFEGWILAAKSVFPNHKFTVEYDHLKDSSNPHYQRFLTRLWLFESLFGKGSEEPWLELSSPVTSDYVEGSKSKTLKCNVGNKNRALRPEVASNSEADLEFRLCKDNDNDAERNCLSDTFGTRPAYRQFPMGIFRGQVSNIRKEQVAAVSLAFSGKSFLQIFIRLDFHLYLLLSSL